jgi:hypothetical protein
VDLDRRQGSIPLCAELDPGGHLVAGRGADELLLAGELPFHWAAGFHCRKEAEILGNHFLLAAESAADTLREDVQVARSQAEDVAELLLRDKGRLRARAHMQPPVITAPGDGAVGLEVNVLNARGGIGHLVHGIGRCEAVRDAADLALDIDIDIARVRPALVV